MSGDKNQCRLASQPKPKLVVNRSSGSGKSSGYRGLRGTSWYVFPGPEGYDDAIYIEQTAAVVVNQRKIVVSAILLAGVVTAVVPTVFLYSQSSPSDLWLLAAFVFFNASLFAIGAWFLCVLQRHTMPSAIVIDSMNGEIIARLAHRPEWSRLGSLNPELTVGSLRFRDWRNKELSGIGLPPPMRGRPFAVWMRLTSSVGFRWLVMQLCSSEEQAEVAAVEWATVLGLDPDTAFGTSSTPEYLYYRRDVQR